jgi:hypothetical protein
MPTRRTVITGAAAAALLAGCGGREPRKLAGSAADIPLLQEQLDAERFEIAVVASAVDRLGADGAALARIVLEHDRQHADALAQAIRELGGGPRPARGASSGDLGLGRGAREALQSVISLKARVAGSYERAIPTIANPRLRATFGSIMTVEAEHAEALGTLL